MANAMTRDLMRTSDMERMIMKPIIVLALCISGQMATGKRFLDEDACKHLDANACDQLSSCKACWDGRSVSCVTQSSKLSDSVLCQEPGKLVNASCDSLSESPCKKTSGCTWCESAAVGNSCFTKEDAAKLPSAIFTCSASAFQ